MRSLLDLNQPPNDLALAKKLKEKGCHLNATGKLMMGQLELNTAAHWKEQHWLAIRDEQTELIHNTADLDNTVKDQLAQTLKGQDIYYCSICGLRGHEAAACWINAQMHWKVKSN